MNRFRAVLLTIGIVTLAGPSPVAQRAAPAAPPELQLTVDSIMRGPDLVGWPPTAIRWGAGSRRLYFDWRKPGEPEPSTYVLEIEGGQPRRLPEDEARNAPPPSGLWDETRQRAIFTEDGDIVLHEGVQGERVHITRTSAVESHPRWAREGTHVTYVRDGNLFIAPARGGSGEVLIQVTDVHRKAVEPRLSDSQRFIREEEEKLIEHLRRKKAEKERAEKKARPYKLPAFELEERQRAVDLMLSPDESHVFIVVAESQTGAKETVVPHYITESGYVEDTPARTHVGETQDRQLLGILNLETGKSVWADGSFAPPVQREVDEDGRQRKEDHAEREIRWAMPVVSADGRQVVASARSADNKERWLVTLDPDTGRTRVIDALRDEAWVRESGFEDDRPLEFLPDNRRIAFLSERDGWMHLYTLDVTAASAQPAQLTAGRWEIAAAALSPDRQMFYITTTEVHPGERHVYRLPVEGGERTRLTGMAGGNEVIVSHDGAMLALVHSYSNRPPELYVMPNRPGAEARRITVTPTAEWRAFNWIDPRVITFKARDGVNVYARLFTPEMIGARRDRSRAAVVFVHGAGYLQNAHRYWSTYFREYMFHNLLASRGYVVLDVDYRASAGYGRDWRTAVYRHMGGKDLDDIVDGAGYLVSREGIDPGRIGIYGGSYGGFITLMAMFTTPDVFAAGAALRPVTDWARYNHGYTSNILNVPQRDAEAYRRSSPIYFAEGLKGALLICHGMVDDNVHFQDSVRLAQRLIELRKDNWELAAYPVESHAFERETSWADEYRRILRLFDDNLRNTTGTRSRS